MTEALKKRYLFSWNFDKFICVFFSIFFFQMWKKGEKYYDVDDLFFIK